MQMDNFNFTLEDLLIAYRKVKTDIYYDNGYDNLIKLANYEEDLITNLNQLKESLNSGNYEYFYSHQFLGDFKYLLKNIEYKKDEAKQESGFVYFSNQIKDWENSNSNEIEEVTFRYIGYHSIDFHILSSLWIDKVGVYLERFLSESSYGSRLKRPYQKLNKFIPEVDSIEFDLEYRKLNCHFRPYIWDYKRWQDDGIKAIEESLKKSKNVAVLTADIKKFFHSITADFLNDEKFYSFLNSDYSHFDNNKESFRFTKLLVNLLNQWSSLCLERISNEVLKYGNHCGLPVGLSASKVIANLYLSYFDSKISKEINPIHYGRYVDDIFLVIENNYNFQNTRDVWEYIEVRIPECRYWNDPKNEQSESSAKFFLPFGNNDVVEFGIKKEKLFVLEESTGLSFIETIKESMKENSSEWRLLPDSDQEIENLGKQIASANSNNEESVNSLGKSDGISIQRLKFALKLRNFESLSDLVPKSVWGAGLIKFLKLCENFIISPQQFSTYLTYYPRIVGLAVKAEEYDFAVKLIERFHKCWESIMSKSLIRNIYVNHHLMHEAWVFAEDLILEAIAANSHFNDFEKQKKHNKAFYKLNNTKYEFGSNPQKLFLSDLHSISFKNIFYNDDIYKDLNIRRNKGFFELRTICKYTSLIEDEKISELIQAIKEKDKLVNHLPNAIFFYTRPFNTIELTILLNSWSLTNDVISKTNEFLGLFLIPPIKVELKTNEIITTLKIRNQNIEELEKNEFKGKDSKPTIALTSFYTDEKSWVANVREDGLEPDNTRVVRLFRLINEILNCEKEINYVVFPELSIPRQLIIYIANKLKSKRISLITGIEYSKNKNPLTANINGIVSNQLLYVLNTFNGTYYEQVAIIQEKVIPAFHEEQDLYATGGLVLESKSDIKYIIQHGSFFFSGLICNELLNIDYRQPLRGQIDALFVVEWNKDIEMYDPLIASTSNDLHCFMVQVNNRKYGDTRLRGPFKETFERDKVRVRGGELDYFVVATIDVKELREFQRNHRSPDKPFKPVPTGFELSDERRKIDLI